MAKTPVTDWKTDFDHTDPRWIEALRLERGDQDLARLFLAVECVEQNDPTAGIQRLRRNRVLANEIELVEHFGGTQQAVELQGIRPLAIARVGDAAVDEIAVEILPASIGNGPSTVPFD